jgi:hypothetical protein
MKETEYWQRTDTFEQKLDLLKGAFERCDFILARAFTESLKEHSCVRTARRGKPRGAATPSGRIRARS